jgi:hypothetical protein
MLGPRSPPRPSNPWQDAQTDSNAFRPSSAEERPARLSLAGDFLFCAPACNTSAQAEKNTEAMAAQRMRRVKRNVKTAPLQFVVCEPISVILSWAAESDFAALPMNFEELKVSFALQKIPLTMKDGDATLSIGDLDDSDLRIPGRRSGAKAGERIRI